MKEMLVDELITYLNNQLERGDITTASVTEGDAAVTREHTTVNCHSPANINTSLSVCLSVSLTAKIIPVSFVVRGPC